MIYKHALVSQPYIEEVVDYRIAVEQKIPRYLLLFSSYFPEFALPISTYFCRHSRKRLESQLQAHRARMPNGIRPPLQSQ